MTKNPRFLLMYTPLQFTKEDSAKPEGSLGLLYLAEALRKNGYEVDILDACVGNDKHSLQNSFFRKTDLKNGLIRIGLSDDDILSEVEKYDVIGITSLFTQQTTMVVNLIRLIKNNYPDKLIIMGGVNARSMRERFILEGVDIICLSEAESTILEIGKVLCKGSRDFSNIDGIVSKNKIRPTTKIEIDLDNLPLPAWDLLPFEKYWEIARPHGGGFNSKDKIRYASMMTSRGCINSCKYCHYSTEDHGSIYGKIKKIRFKSINRVFHEIDILQGLGIQYLFFEDDVFLIEKERVCKILDGIKKRKLILSNVNGVRILGLCKQINRKYVVDKDLLSNMREAGFIELTLPFESGSQRIINDYCSGKFNLEKTDTDSIIQEAKKIGIVVGGNYLIGFPDETEDEMTETILLAKRHMDIGMDRANLMCVVPFPGSGLFDQAVSNRNLEYPINTDKLNWLYPTMKNTLVAPEVLRYVNKICWKLLNKPYRINNIDSMRIDN